MAYIGQNLDRFSNVEKLDAITPATSTGAGPYNLTKGGVAFTPSSADTMVVSIDGVIQYGNFSVSGSTITFDAALADANTCDFIYHMGTGLLSTPVDNSVSTVKIVDSNVTNAKLAGSIANSKLANSAITINGSAVSLGGSVTVGETKPTISSISPTVITNAQTAVTINGGGEAYINGIAGERFCVRNSGAKAVVEGVGDHGCEYMTGGTVLILGKIGRNFGAGMSGGIAYIYKDDKRSNKNFNMEMIDLEAPNIQDEDIIYEMLENHFSNTNSEVAEKILSNWKNEKKNFIKVMPKEYKIALERIAKEKIDQLIQ